jgi:hypothetical protein
LSPSGSEAPQIRRRRRRAKIADDAAVVLIASALGNNIYGAPRAASIFGEKWVRKNVHLIERFDWEIRENGLPSPHIYGIGAIDLKPRLPASRSVGRKQIPVHKDVALILSASRTQVSDLGAGCFGPRTTREKG